VNDFISGVVLGLSDPLYPALDLNR